MTALSVDASGRYMATAGADTRVKVWDIRTFKPLQDYFSIKPVTTMDISQRDMLALGFGSHVRVRLPACRGSVCCVCVSDPRTLMLACRCGRIALLRRPRART